MIINTVAREPAFSDPCSKPFRTSPGSYSREILRVVENNSRQLKRSCTRWKTRLYRHLLTVSIILNKQFLRQNLPRFVGERCFKVAGFTSKLSDVGLSFTSFQFRIKEL